MAVATLAYVCPPPPPPPPSRPTTLQVSDWVKRVRRDTARMETMHLLNVGLFFFRPVLL